MKNEPQDVGKTALPNGFGGGEAGRVISVNEEAGAASPTMWDRGADGSANQADLVEEERPFVDPETGEEINPNGIRGCRRQTWVHRYLLAGKLTVRQYMAALALSDAALGMPAQDPLAALRVRVQGGSDPEAAKVDARRNFRRLWAAVPSHCRPVVERVVLDNRAVWSGGRAQAVHTERLGIGLDAVAAVRPSKVA